MNFSLTRNLEQFVRDKAKSGDYNNSSEAVREAIRLFKRTEEMNEIKMSQLRVATLQGDEAIARGESTSLGSEKQMAEFFAEL